MPSVANYNNFIFMLIVAGVYLLTIIATFVVNLSKYRIGYLLSGAMVLLCTMLIITGNGRIVRNADEVRKYFDSHCAERLKFVSADHLKENGCPKKYTELN